MNITGNKELIMRKRLIALALCSALAFTSLLGCSKKNQGGTDPVVVDVRIYKAGYGTEWFKSAKEKFEALYADQGYTINIVDESDGVSDKARSEMPNKKTNSIDLYIVGESNFAEYLRVSKSALKTEEEVLLENLNDVYSSPAIRFDGSEESVTIDSKLNDSIKRFMKYNGTTSSTYAYLNNFAGNYYAFPWASGVSGFLINKTVFDNYGLELPRTTDELLAAYDVMCPEDSDGKPTPKVVQIAVDEHGNTEDFSAYPMSYPGQSSGYWLFAYDTFFAQYSGAEAEANFWLCKPAEGTMEDNGYDVYKDEGILKALEVVEKLCDDRYCKRGTINLKETEAQLEVLSGNAAIMPTGNWAYQQMKLNYSEYVDNGVMMKMPVISALGTKLGISDEVLSGIVKGVDEGKTDSAIAAEFGVDETTIVARVREARNIYFDYSVNHIALIPSYSPSKAVAKLFLRFLASDDNLDLYKTKAYSSLPFKYAGESKVVDNAFVRSVDEIMGYGKNVAVYEDLCTSPIRQQGLHCFPSYGMYPTVFKGFSQRTLDAETVYKNNKDQAEKDWPSLKHRAGIK